ncbi:MAG: tetratricopeptide repeat protein [Candidatus Eisenbacteria bacterium]
MVAPIHPRSSPGREKTTHRLVLAAILLATLFLRLLFVFHVERSELTDDMAGDVRPYRERAGEILRGDLIGSEVFFDAPLFPYFLALFGAGPGGPEAPAKAVNALLDTASAFLLFLLTRTAFGAGAGLLAPLLYGLYGFGLFYDGLLLKPPLAIFLLLLSARKVLTGRGLSAGISLGLAALVRGNFLLLAPVWLLVAGRSSRRSAGRLAIGLLLPVLAVTVRNGVVGGDFVPLTYHAGPTFYHGNHSGSRGIYAPIVPGRQNPPYEKEDAVRIAEEEEGRKLRPSEVNRFWFRRALSFIAEDPARFRALTLRRAGLFWRGEEIPDTFDFRIYRRYFPELSAALLGFGVIAPLGVLGWFYPRRLRGADLLFPGSVLVFFLTLSLLFVFGRYRLPVVPFLIPTAARYLAHAGGLAAGRLWRPLARAALPAAALIVLANAGGPVVGPAGGLYNMGIRFESLGRTEEAEAMYREATEASPGFPSAWNNLGGILLGKGDRAGAAAAFDRAIEADSDHVRARRNAAFLARDEGRFEDARRHLLRALAAERSAENLTDLAVIEEVTGHTEEAESLYREALEKDPGQGEGAANLGRLLAISGRAEEAIPLLEIGARQLPDEPSPPLYLALAHAQTGDFDAAEEALKRAERAGADVRARILEGRLLAARGDAAGAAAVLARARAEGLPDDATVRLFLGVSLRWDGRGR